MWHKKLAVVYTFVNICKLALVFRNQLRLAPSLASCRTLIRRERNGDGRGRSASNEGLAHIVNIHDTHGRRQVTAHTRKHLEEQLVERNARGTTHVALDEKLLMCPVRA